MHSSSSRRRALPSALFTMTLAIALVASTPAPVRAADVCVTLDEARDTFSPSDRAAALLLLKQQFELAGERIVDAGCQQPYVVSHVATNLDRESTYWDGNGLQGELTGGYEMGRAGSMHIFVQADAGLPFYRLRSTTYTYINVYPYSYQSSVSHRYVPTLTVSLGLGWQKGGGK